MTIYYVTCQDDATGQSTTIQTSGHDPLEASLRATAQAKREWCCGSVSSRAISTTKPTAVKAQPVQANLL